MYKYWYLNLGAIYAKGLEMDKSDSIILSLNPLLQTVSRIYDSILFRRFSKWGRKSGLTFQHLTIMSYLKKKKKLTIIFSNKLLYTQHWHAL